MKSQSEEIASLRKTLAERDLTILSLRFQVQESSTCVINIKVPHKSSFLELET